MILEADAVCFCYSGSPRLVLDNVTLQIDQGEILSILGPNGSGKSTLLNCMAGLLKPTLGVIRLRGRDLAKLDHRSIAKTISYVPQGHTPTFDYTVMHFVMMGRAPDISMFQKPRERDEAITLEALRALSIEHLAERSYVDISGGERQQVMIARAIAQQPQLILFDEPTAHLDYGNQHRILKLIRTLTDRGYGIIITTHNPDHALLLGGTAAIIDSNGRLSAGPSAEMITEERLKDVYNTELSILYVEELKRLACLPTSLT